jgi:hypothetical protein
MQEMGGAPALGTLRSGIRSHATTMRCSPLFSDRGTRRRPRLWADADVHVPAAGRDGGLSCRSCSPLRA